VWEFHRKALLGPNVRRGKLWELWWEIQAMTVTYSRYKTTLVLGIGVISALTSNLARALRVVTGNNRVSNVS
jgi:hypothetical protein